VGQPPRLFVALYRASVRLQPASRRRLYGEEQIQVAEELWARDRPTTLVARVVWSVQLLIRALWAALGSHVDVRRTARVLTRPQRNPGGGGWKGGPRLLSSLARRPAFAAGIVSTLALVIGASTAIFSTLYGVVLRPLPYPDPGRLVAISESDHAIGAANTLVTDGAVPILIQDSRSFERVGAWSPARANPQDISATRLWGTHQRIVQQYCTSGVFAALRVTLVLGRNFSADEDAASAGRSHVAILSYGFWQAHYGGDPRVLGRTLSVDSFGVKEDEAIVGVMPEGVAFPSPFSAVRPDLWINLRLVATPFLLGHRLNVVARLKPGVSLAQGRAELSTMGDRIRADHARAYKDITLQMAPLQDALVRGVQPILWPLVAALGAILLVGCTNIACLLVVRAGARRRELAVRAALGAGRFALFRQTLTETLTLSAIGGALGLMLAAGGLRLLVTVMPASLHVPRLDAVPLEWPVLLIAAGVSAAAAVVFGAWPALRLLRPALVDDLKASDTAQERRGSLARMTGWLLTGEIAVALVLVTGTALLTQSVRRFLDANALFQPEHLVSFGVGFTNAYVHATPDFEAQFPVLYAQFRARVEAMPGVRAVTFLDHWPVVSLADFPNTFSERGSGPDERARLPAEMEVVDQSYRDVAHTTLARGRWFADMDTKAAPPVAVINAAMAERYFAGRDPIGVRIAPKSLRWTDDEVLYTIIGVVDEPRRFGSGLPADPTVFLDITQVPLSSRWVVVRSSGDPAALLTPLRQAALAIVPGAMAVGRLQTGEDVTAESSARARFAGWLLTAFSGLALVLAVVGIYAVVSYETSRRHREIGIRMALGATPGGVRRLVARGVGLQVGAGILGGLIAAYLFGRTLSGLLYGTSPSDPASFAEGALAMIVVATLASYLPARRAAAIDPIEALRRD
jgi:putative ABC transport system permease protein